MGKATSLQIKLLLADHLRDLDVSSVAEADLKELNPSIGRVRRLMNLWSCSTVLLRYLDLTVVILV